MSVSQCLSVYLVIVSLVKGSFLPNTLQLIGGDLGGRSGRLQIYHNNRWGTICDDYFALNEAIVACRQLGFTTGYVGYKSRAFYGRGSGPIWIDDLRCSGNESSIDKCSFNGWGSHNCYHSEDVGVVCDFKAIPEINSVFMWTSSSDSLFSDAPTPSYTAQKSKTARLTKTKEPNSGVVEVKINGVWGTVCGRNWNQINSKVLCRQLGYPDAVEYFLNAYYGPGNGPILMNKVNCRGTETEIQKCRYSSNSTCDHYEDVGVHCVNPLRSSGGVGIQSENEDLSKGFAEIFINNTWHYVCSSICNSKTAKMFCQQLGYPGVLEAKPFSQFNRWWGIDINCQCNKDQLQNCQLTENDYCHWFAWIECETWFQYYSRMPLKPTMSVKKIQTWKEIRPNITYHFHNVTTNASTNIDFDERFNNQSLPTTQHSITSTLQAGDKSNLSSGATAGLSVSAAILLIFLTVLAWCLKRRQARETST
ncbi:neurotrypsin-like isoform X2 [Oscarella lobularis]|uniref:neurotrypsin-like isoform X2 n=1 Tax=Oscarella lobularis TaxID=121494 RepID=UPI003313FC10